MWFKGGLPLQTALSFIPVQLRMAVVRGIVTTILFGVAFLFVNPAAAPGLVGPLTVAPLWVWSAAFFVTGGFGLLAIAHQSLRVLQDSLTATAMTHAFLAVAYFISVLKTPAHSGMIALVAFSSIAVGLVCTATDLARRN